MKKRENDVYSEQNVNNVLLKRYEATHRKDSFVMKISWSSVRGKKIDHEQLYVLA